MSFSSVQFYFTKINIIDNKNETMAGRPKEAQLETMALSNKHTNSKTKKKKNVYTLNSTRQRPTYKRRLYKQYR